MEYQIRKAVLDDAKGIAKVHIYSWKLTYKGLISDEFLNNRGEKDKYDTEV